MKKTADSNLNMGNTHRVTNVPNAIQNTDVIPKGQADSLYVSKTTPLNEITKATGHLDMNGYKVINT
jgi:hypothetical protein